MKRTDEQIKKSFQKNFDKLRGEKTNTEFAAFLGISRQTVGFYLNGDRMPDACQLVKIANRCNVSIDYLLGLTDKATPNMDERAAIEYTGLKEETLKKWKVHYYPASEFKDYYTYSPIDFINEFLFDDFTLGIVSGLCSSISGIQRCAEHPSILELNKSELDELEEIDERLEKYGMTSFNIAKFHYNEAIAEAADFHACLNDLIRDVYELATEHDRKLHQELMAKARARISKEAQNGIDET